MAEKKGSKGSKGSKGTKKKIENLEADVKELSTRIDKVNDGLQELKNDFKESESRILETIKTTLASFQMNDEPEQRVRRAAVAEEDLQPTETPDVPLDTEVTDQDPTPTDVEEPVIDYSTHGLIVTSEENYITATSYISVEDVNNSLSNEYFLELWKALPPATKVDILMGASFNLDGAFSYRGYPSDKNQILKFPRNGYKNVPLPIKKVATMLVKQTLTHVDLITEGEVLEEKIDQIRLKYNKSTIFGKKTNLSYAMITMLNPYKITTFNVDEYIYNASS